MSGSVTNRTQSPGLILCLNDIVLPARPTRRSWPHRQARDRDATAQAGSCSHRSRPQVRSAREARRPPAHCPCRNYMRDGATARAVETIALLSDVKVSATLSCGRRQSRRSLSPTVAPLWSLSMGSQPLLSSAWGNTAAYRSSRTTRISPVSPRAASNESSRARMCSWITTRSGTLSLRGRPAGHPAPCSRDRAHGSASALQALPCTGSRSTAHGAR